MDKKDEEIKKLDKLKNIIKNSNNIVFFGGAGVSTESNIPDFRSTNGLYKTKNNFSYPPEIILSHDFFFKHTEDFFRFYKSKMVYKEAKPNYAHIALAKLEKQDKLKAVITQNIDALHQAAGSKNVLELHGSIYQNYCTKCNKKFDLDYILNSEGVPVCDKCGSVIKPNVVLYGESLDQNTLYKSLILVSQADVLIVAGTSLTVYPAAGIINYYSGNKLVLINKEKTSFDSNANLVINKSVAEVFKYCVE